MSRTRMLLPFFLCLVLISLLFIAAPSARAGEARLPEKRPDALKDLDIRDTYVPAGGFSRAGLVHALQGTLVVVHRADQGAFVASKGDPIHENDELFTLADSRCRIRFSSDDVVNMAPDTHFSVETFVDRPERGQKTSLFSLIKGKAMFYALRLFRYKQTRFKVKTPTAVVGVRGTQFGVHVFRLEEKRAETRGVLVANREGNHPFSLAQAGSGSGPRTGTIVACGDGQLDVMDPLTGQRFAQVNPNEDFNTATGKKTFDPRNRTLNQISAEAEVHEEGTSNGENGTGMEDSAGGGTGDDTKGDGEDEAGDPLGDPEGDSGIGASADVMEGIINTTSLEVQEEVAGGGDISQGMTLGRVYGFNFFITNNTYGLAWFSPGPPTKTPFYESNEPGQDGPTSRTGGPEALVGYEYFQGDDGGSDYQVVLQEEDAPLTKATVNQFDWGTGGDISLASPHTFQYIKANSYTDENGHEYMEWGWWEDTSGTEIGKIGDDGVNNYYAASGKIWHIEGDITHPDYIDYLQSQGAHYTYTGEAKGVYVNSSAADVHELSGGFSCDVDFGSRQVSDFSIDASGAGHTVHINNGTGVIDHDSTFDIESYSGDIDGSALDTSEDAAGAAFVGGKAQGIGGVWRAWDGGDQWAGGEFHGKR